MWICSRIIGTSRCSCRPTRALDDALQGRLAIDEEVKVFHDVIVYERQGFLRTVARFDDRLAAENQLANIQRYKASAYIVDLAKWCSNTEDAGKEIGTASLNTCVSQ